MSRKNGLSRHSVMTGENRIPLAHCYGMEPYNLADACPVNLKSRGVQYSQEYKRDDMAMKAYSIAIVTSA